MRIPHSPCIAIAVLSLPFVAACSDSAARSPIVPDRTPAVEREMTPEQMRELTGVDRLPEVVDKAAFRTAMERNYPAELRSEAISGSALVDVRIDPDGTVASVSPIDRPAGARMELVLEERDGTQRRVVPQAHPAFQAAAIKALRTVRFSPARRDGVAVPFTLRMTVTFDPPAGRSW